MMIQRSIRLAAAFVFLYASAPFHAQNASAQVFDFGQIDAFESLGSGTQRGGSAPKTLVDDDQRHVVVFTILESDTDAKIYWRSVDGNQTTLMRGQGVKVFQVLGQLKIEALGDANHSFKYGYTLFRLKDNKAL
jgi:hypothetical protein